MKLLVLNRLMNNGPVEPRWGSPDYMLLQPAFHAGLLRLNPFRIPSSPSSYLKILTYSSPHILLSPRVLTPSSPYLLISSSPYLPISSTSPSSPSHLLSLLVN